MAFVELQQKGIIIHNGYGLLNRPRDSLKCHYVVKKAINFICIYLALTEFIGEDIIRIFSFLLSFQLCFRNKLSLPRCRRDLMS